jgi:DNA-binding transcriptional MerR regulator
MNKSTYSIGEVVRLLHQDCGVTESSLRFWEKMGLIRSQRTPGGHRVYTEDDLKRIRLIKRLQTQLYMPLSKIRKLCQPDRATDELVAFAEFKESFYRPLGYDPSFQPLTLAEVAERTGLAPAVLHALADAGAFRPMTIDPLDASSSGNPSGGGPRYDEDGLRIAEIFQELSRFGVDPADIRETCERTEQLVEAQYRYFLDKISPAQPAPLQASRIKHLNELGQELTRLIYHQTYLAVGARLARAGEFDPAVAPQSQKAKDS